MIAAEATAASGWTSLEIAKLVAAIATPIVVLVVGWLVTNRLQKQINTEDKLIEKRIAVFDRVAPQYNDLLTYLLYWGNWQKLTPVEVVAKKRELDKDIHVYSWLFKGDIVDAHNAFMAVCFDTYRGKGLSAAIRSDAAPRRNRPDWEPEWDALFTGENSADNAAAITTTYTSLLGAIASELAKGSDGKPFVSGAIVTPG
jgi:hypothetical protein